MSKFLFTFLGLTFILSTAIIIWRDLSSKERWSLLKTFGFAIVVSILACFLLGVFVALF